MPYRGQTYGEDFISQPYLRRYGMDTPRAQSWAGKPVHIRTENGLWREDARGYTTHAQGDAWVLPFEEAVRQISHCGPEKRGTFVLFKEEKRADTPRNQALEAAAVFVETHKPCNNQAPCAIRPMASGELSSVAQIEYARAIRGLKA
mgnify:FL=1